MSTDVFEIRLGQNVNMYTNRLGWRVMNNVDRGGARV
jgi:hypothetical protein